MRRLTRIITALSLFLCAGTIALWILSDGAPFQWEWTATDGPEDAAWSRGQLCAGEGRIGYVAWIPESKALMRYRKPYHRFHRMTPDAFSYDHMSLFDPSNGVWWRGVEYIRSTDQFTHITLRKIWLPFWLIVVGLFMLPLLRVTVWLRQSLRASHRRRQGRCISCGYNLAGNTSGTCPECGMRLHQKISKTTASA